MTRAADSRGNVTIRDVANRAGVSIGTVSRALKNQPGLTEETRQQVLRAALELGYDTSNLRQSKLRRVSFLMSRLPDFPVNPFYSHVLHGVEDACRTEEIVMSYTSLRPGDRVIEVVRRHEADGLLCVGFFEPKLLERIAGVGLPIVLVDHSVPGFTAVNIDNISGAKQAVQHLLETGRKRIAFVKGPAHHSVQQRIRGFREALFEAGIPADPNLEVGFAPFHSPESARQALEALLALPNPPDAIFCWNDETALSILRHCVQVGLRVPEDIAVVGFDDIDAAINSNPRLSTVRVDKEALGRVGLEVLMNRERFDASGPVVPVNLLVRESSLLREAKLKSARA